MPPPAPPPLSPPPPHPPPILARKNKRTCPGDVPSSHASTEPLDRPDPNYPWVGATVVIKFQKYHSEWVKEQSGGHYLR
jgi:hypothetical protein